MKSDIAENKVTLLAESIPKKTALKVPECENQIISAFKEAFDSDIKLAQSKAPKAQQENWERQGEHPLLSLTVVWTKWSTHSSNKITVIFLSIFSNSLKHNSGKLS